MAGTITHQWNGTILTITSDSGTSSADLKGEKGDTGIRGAQGIQGLKGEKGAGEKGEKGDAFTYADFTEEQLAALVGPEGPAGARGDVGPEGRTSAYNYLDNSYFPANYVINQRGKTSYTNEDGYKIDRWMSSAQPFTIGDNGLTLQGASGSNVLRQRLPYLADGYYTIAAKVGGYIAVRQYQKTGTTYTKTYENATYAGGYMALINNQMPEIQIRANSGNTITIEWAALYAGAYTAETLPPYVYKGYNVEYMNCAYYYQKYTASNNWAWYFTGMASTETEIRVSMPLSYPMRANPTVTYGDIANITIFTTTGLAAAKTWKGTTVYPNTNMLMLYIETNVNLTKGTPSALRLNMDIELSADL